jgi:23S rRNA pseudouridine955/2504/2580 synthase
VEKINGKSKSINTKDIAIVYEDSVIVVAIKPAGLPSQGTFDKDRSHFYAELYDFQRKRYGRKAYLALHHRLDSDTSGLMLFCKEKSYNKQVAALFQERRLHKTYVCAVDESSLKQKLAEGLPPTEWTTDNLLKNVRKGRFLTAKSSASEGDQAITHFKILQRGLFEGQPIALIECTPETGRMHQIRVHLAENQTPVIGDKIYNKNYRFATNQGQRLMLHAWKIRFYHQYLKRELSLESIVPFEFQNLFNIAHHPADKI